MPPDTVSSFTTCTGHDQHGRYPQVLTLADFQHNLAVVQARMAAACQRAGRDAASVRLLPVSKTQPSDRLRLAHAAGCRMLGENKVQEAWGKCEALQDLTDLRWSVIGHLQTNKAKLVARFASEFQALDSLRLAEALALFSHDSARVRQCFVRLRRLRDQLRQSAPAGMSLEELSMGMSGDFDIAIEEGASVVRVGQAIFGARAVPDQHYWPGLAVPVETGGVAEWPLHPN
jgi:hypothetical protein